MKSRVRRLAKRLFFKSKFSDNSEISILGQYDTKITRPIGVLISYLTKYLNVLLRRNFPHCIGGYAKGLSPKAACKGFPTLDQTQNINDVVTDEKTIEGDC
jgi:hypothetical protein